MQPNPCTPTPSHAYVPRSRQSTCVHVRVQMNLVNMKLLNMNYPSP